VREESGRLGGHGRRREDRGFVPTDAAEDADVIVINTCGLIEAAKRESIETILEMAALNTGGAPASGDINHVRGEDTRVLSGFSARETEDSSLP
jgi:tRNA A37 methylthiotransferase MiaB